MKRRFHSMTVEVDVDVEISDIEDDILIKECQDRGFTVLRTEYPAPDLAERAYYALNDAVPAPVREFVLESAGRVS